jgi:hypothetical protein
MHKVACLILALLSFPLLAQQPAPQPSLVREGVTEKLTRHVWVIPDGSASLVPNVGGDTVVLVDGVLFSGDVAMKPQPAFADPSATISHWLDSLDRLEAMKPRHIVPSHGAFGGTGIIAGYRAYLARIRDRAAQLKRAGKSQDEAVQAITDEMVAQYPDRNRLAGAVRAGYAEAN